MHSPSADPPAPDSEPAQPAWAHSAALALPPLAAADAHFEPAPPAAAARAQCANCGVELLGAHCYACGQPVKGMVRHLSSILADAADTILNIDSRIFRTLLPLYFRPGFLTTEYFAGRRVRYVTPFRLYFFLSVAAFFLMQFAFGDIDMGVTIDNDARDKIAQALTAAEVVEQRDAAIEALKKVESSPGMPQLAGKGLDKAVEDLRKAADKRLERLKQAAEARAQGKVAEVAEDGPKLGIGLDSWDSKTDPVDIAWLPHFANDKLTQLGVRAQDNIKKFNKNRDFKPLVIGTVSVLPQVLFVLMPLFALVLKIFYVFKRRLYMEHLIVALHSHAFIFLSLLGLGLGYLGKAWAAQSAPWLETPLKWLVIAIGWWLPVYLFLMQKKVYKQGWIMTGLKYGVIGTGYTIMVTLGVVAAFLVSLATI
jgi:hypothetical protein